MNNKTYSPTSEKTMSPLILLFRFGNANYHPEFQMLKKEKCTFCNFKRGLVERLWEEKEKLTPKHYFNLVRSTAQAHSKDYSGPASKPYISELLEHSIFEHLPELDLGEWGQDIHNIYAGNLTHSSLVE